MKLFAITLKALKLWQIDGTFFVEVVYQIAGYSNSYDFIVLINVNAVSEAITRDNTFISEFLLPVKVLFNLLDHEVICFLFGWFNGGPCSILG
jgi:hypothetical protein